MTSSNEIAKKMNRRTNRYPIGIQNKFDGLTRTQTAIFREIHSMATTMDDISPSHDYIAWLAGCCRRTVGTSLHVLRDRGYITWTSGEKYMDEKDRPRQGTNNYQLTEKALYTLPTDFNTGEFRDVEAEEKLKPMLQCNTNQPTKLIKKKGRHPATYSRKKKPSSLIYVLLNGKATKVVCMLGDQTSTVVTEQASLKDEKSEDKLGGGVQKFHRILRSIPKGIDTLAPPALKSELTAKDFVSDIRKDVAVGRVKGGGVLPLSTTKGSTTDQKEISLSKSEKGTGSLNPPTAAVPPFEPLADQAEFKTEVDHAFMSELLSSSAIPMDKAINASNAISGTQEGSTHTSTAKREPKSTSGVNTQSLLTPVGKFELCETKNAVVGKHHAVVRAQEQAGLRPQIAIHPELRAATDIIVGAYRRAMDAKGIWHDNHFFTYQYSQIAALIQITGSRTKAEIYVEYCVNNWSSLIGTTGTSDAKKLKSQPNLNQILAPFRIQIWSDRSQGKQSAGHLKKLKKIAQAKARREKEKKDFDEVKSRLDEQVAIMAKMTSGEIPMDLSKFKKPEIVTASRYGNISDRVARMSTV